MVVQDTEKSKKKFGIGLVIFCSFVILMLFLSESDTLVQTQQRQSQPTKIQIPAEPQLIGTWYGETEVYLAKEGGKYVAIFEPPVSTLIYPYLVGLLNEVWGLLLSQLSNPQLAPPLVFYENYASGEKFFFLLFKDETTGAVAGVSFWKE